MILALLSLLSLFLASLNDLEFIFFDQLVKSNLFYCIYKVKLLGFYVYFGQSLLMGLDL